MFNFIKINDTQPQKKIFTVQNYDLLNNLIKDEASSFYTTESTVIENHLLSAYLNNSGDDELVYAVVENLFKKRGISSTCGSIFSRFATMPEYANDTLLPLLDYVVTIELRHKTYVKGDEQALASLSKNVGYFRELLEKHKSTHPNFRTPDSAIGYIEFLDIPILKDLENAKENLDSINVDGGLTSLVRLLRKYWYFCGNADTASIKNWSVTYRILVAICELANWPDHPQYRHELVLKIRGITLADGKSGSFDANRPVLTESIHLRYKSLKTTKDAVILHSPSKRTHVHAKRIIHGPQGVPTKVPFIVTFADEEYDLIDEIVEKLVSENEEAKKEFPNPKDAYCVPIYYDGQYIDDRVKWNTF